MSLPPEIKVHATSDRVHYRLPFRRLVPGDLPGGTGGCLGCGGSLAGVFFLVYLAFASNGVVAAIVASPLAILALAGLCACLWMAIGGRSEILLTRKRLFLRERVGPLVFRRSLDPARVVLFRAHPTDAGKGALDMEIREGAGRRWAVDYPMPLLEALASDLARRRDEILKAPPAGPADVEILPQGLRITARPTGLRSWLTPLVAVAMALLSLVAGSLLGLLAEHGREHLPVVGTALGLAWAGLMVAGAHALRVCRRSTVFESSAKALKVIERDFLGRRVREWPRADIWGFEVAGGRLQFRLSNGKRPTVLSGRDGPTLEWIAGILRRGAPKRDVEVVATTTSKGTCQVCATPMEERVVWCRRCRTPHHLECWAYTGMCSTFGCREIGYAET